MLLVDLALVSDEVSATSSRAGKTRLVADALRRAGPAEVGLVVAYLSGQPRQRRPGVGWSSLRERPSPAAAASLTLTDVDGLLDALTASAGPGSAARRRSLLDAALAAATAPEQGFLTRLLLGELRQGALEAVVVEAVAQAAGVPVGPVRRAAMLRGEAAAVAEIALTEGEAGLAAVGLVAGRAVQPMLAQSAPDVAGALARTGRAGVEWKLDGVRVQVHRAADGAVRVFTRSLDDVTARLPEVVAAVLVLPARSLVLDGEVLALRPDGRPAAFQDTASRFADRASGATAVPLVVWFFDLLHLDGRDLLDEPGTVRWAALDGLVPVAQRVPRTVTEDPAQAQRALEDALAAGHEGVVVKAVDAPWEAGRRGAGWVKVKPVHTLDLVVVAAEWGSGRRQGWLSNLHLAARADLPGEGFVMLGKTFKGLTDAVLGWQTEQLLARETGRTGHVVHVRPELVVEIALDGLQRSTRYPGGVAMRFARVVRYRPDKAVGEADTLHDVRRLMPPG